jgi:hypothetical protein
VPTECLPVGEGAVEGFDLVVGVWQVGAGLLRGDAEFLTGVALSMGLVRGAVVGEYPLYGDTMLGVPGQRPFEDTDGGDGFLSSWIWTYPTREWSSIAVYTNAVPRRGYQRVLLLAGAHRGRFPMLFALDSNRRIGGRYRRGCCQAVFTSTWMNDPGVSCS